MLDRQARSCRPPLHLSDFAGVTTTPCMVRAQQTHVLNEVNNTIIAENTSIGESSTRQTEHFVNNDWSEIKDA